MASAPRSILLPGDPAPWFRAPSNVNPDFDFASAAGRFIVLSFMGPADQPVAKTMFDGYLKESALFSDPDRYFFGIVIGGRDAGDPRMTRTRSGMDVFWDRDGSLSRRYGALPFEGDPGAFAPVSYLLGLDLRVLATVRDTPLSQHAADMLGLLRRLPPIGLPHQGSVQAPVLILPNVLEPGVCRQLIEGYQTAGGTESGFMREQDGKSVVVLDHKHKRRSDWIVEDRSLKDALQDRVLRRLVPEVQKTFQFKVTRMERYIVACYDSAVGGYFHPHRDNTTKGTAHRRFAVTINLNTDDYEGGELMFPEYGRTTFRPPTGGAVVFSCGLLHQALPVHRGRRFAFLPFLYDEAAAKIRAENNAYLGDSVAPYRLGQIRD